ncbi:exo-alpha-sialidase [Rhodoferax sp. AJA081-3]|uniref:sialidase family protein n=1 Tax=Rhodoferax sp. AJA081-3 TaxID=2752316 RepID=UPI001AE0782A|nr:sialidase family protein [Rhodoferax sp. AJA081-3]QTN26109.1 exo-alpha-sialidase [Rhodoferax sp. AJA081-3]
MSRLLTILVSLIGLTGCAISAIDSTNESLVQISDMQTGPFATRPSLADVGGELAVLYASKDDRVVLQIGSQAKQAIDTTARVRAGGSFFKLWPQQNHIYASWWSHKRWENIYITSSGDGGKSFAPVSMVNTDNGVLPPFTLTLGPPGTLGMTYSDERIPGFQVFFNRSIDHGLTWQKSDQRLDSPPAEGRASIAHDPQTVESGSTWVSTWSESIHVSGKPLYRIVSRRTNDAGVTWTAPAVLFSSDHQISTLIVRSEGRNLIIAADDLNRGIFALASQDSGVTWSEAVRLEDTAGLSNSGIAMEYRDGRAHLVWMAQRAEAKIQIMAATFDVSKNAWLGGRKRLNPATYENTKALSPVVHVTKGGAVVSAWVDYRDIRPNIYIATSYDQGNRGPPPQPLLQPGLISVGWPALVRVKDKTYIAFEKYPTERVADGSFHVRELPVDAGANAMAKISSFPVVGEKERAAKLTERIKALWDYRVAGNYDRAYDIFDFAYKTATPKKLYIENAGVITYLAHHTDEVTITGNEANVKMKVKYEVKSAILPTTGKPITVAPVEVEVPNQWVWIGDDWYLVYTPSFDQPMLKY